MMIVCSGQLSIFDSFNDSHVRKPCEYSFKRFLGQRVSVLGHVGKVIRIEPYYTIVRSGHHILAGTPTTTSEVL